MAEGLKKGFLQAPKIKEQKPETSNSSSSTSSLIKQQFSQSQQPPSVENQRQSQIKQELKQTETEQNEQQNIYFLPKPKSSNYMKSNNAKIMTKQKNEDQLLIETLLQSVLILKEEVKILRQENQKLLEKIKILKKDQSNKKSKQNNLDKKSRTFNLRNKNGSRRRQANRTNQYQKVSQEMLPVLIKIPQLQDIQKTDEEKQRRSMKRINKNLCDKGWKNLRKRIFQSSSRTPKKLGDPNFYFKPPGAITGLQRK